MFRTLICPSSGACDYIDGLAHRLPCSVKTDGFAIIVTLKPLNNPSLLIPYEQFYIQTLHREGKLIPEQSPGEANPLFQMAISTQPPHTTQTEQ